MNHYFTNEKVSSNLQKKTIKVNEKLYNFYTDNGVFSKKGLGYGIIGIILASFFDITLDMVDINSRAIHLAKMNVKENKVDKASVFVSDIYSEVNKKYDFIITNPPIRAGKEVVYNFLLQAKDYLKDNGALYFVINKDQGALSVYNNLSKEYKIEILEKNKGFLIFKCNL